MSRDLVEIERELDTLWRLMAENDPPGRMGLLDETSGWCKCGHGLAYANATTFTTVGDLTGLYTAGLRLRLTQTTVKYFVVISSSYTGGLTTVTITGGSDYSLANAGISDPYFSRMNMPEGWPGWFNYTPTWTGTTTNPTIGNGECSGRFEVIGKSVHVRIYTAWGSTTNSGAGNYAWTLPITSYNEGCIHLGLAHCRDVGNASWERMAQVGPNASTTTTFGADMTAANNNLYINPTTPFTFAQNDNVTIDIWYRFG